MEPETLKQEVVSFLEKLAVPFESVKVSHKQRTVISVQSPNAHILLGAQGENLQAINMLLHRLLEKKYGEESANFLVDVNNYHESKMETIRQNARMLAQKARLFKHDVDLEPMNAYERLVVHECFADDTQIQTVSQGEGKFRHIVLKYRP